MADPINRDRLDRARRHLDDARHRTITADTWEGRNEKRRAEHMTEARASVRLAIADLLAALDGDTPPDPPATAVTPFDLAAGVVNTAATRAELEGKGIAA